MTLINHLEKEFGTVNGGWSAFPEGEKWLFQVAELKNGRYQGISVYSTIGLSRFPLRSAVNQELLHMELFVMVPEELGYVNIPSILYSIGLNAIQNKQSYLRGNVVHGKIVNTSFDAFYLTYPAYYLKNLKPREMMKEML